MLKIAVYTICKNENVNVKGWLASVKGADYVCVADTGSTDNTVELFKKARVTANHISIDPWRFDDAHNAALALVPADADVCIPLHLDERLMAGWREAIERKWLPGLTTKLFYTYVFSHNPDGSADLSFLQNRIHARKGYRWKYPDHEGVYPYGIHEMSETAADLRIEQFQDRSKDRGGILGRLEMGLSEYPNDSRIAFYLGREYMYAGKWLQAIGQLERYLTMPGSPFPTERAQAADCIARCWRALGG